jgi:DNA-binding transcriptional MocR family regulator
LVAIAERHDLMIIEDGAYAFLGEPSPPPVMALAPHRTVYVAGLSKSVASGLRVGMVAAPLAWIPPLEEAIRLTTWSSSALPVALACEWIESGVVDRLEEGKRADARRRQQVARAALKGLAPIGHRTSYFLWLDLPVGVRAEVVAADLLQRGIVVATGDAFSAAKSAQQGLRVAIGSVPMDTLGNALAVVRETVEARA